MLLATRYCSCAGCLKSTAMQVCVGLASLIFGAWPALSSEIGSVTAANPRIDGTPPSGETRILRMGARVVSDEIIVTSEIGSGQFAFLDQTTLTVSPGSEIVLDRYIFDPERGTGEVALTMTKGVLRFIGGKITKSGVAMIMTPHATIGIRGGIAAITVGEEGTNAVFLAGKNMCVKGQVETLCTTRSGGLITVKAATEKSGEATKDSTEDFGASTDQTEGTDSSVSEADAAGTGEPVYEGVAEANQISAIYQSTETGGTGGTTQPIEPATIDSTVAATGLSDVGAGSAGATTDPPVTTSGEETSQEQAPSEEASTAETRSEPETTVTSAPPEMLVDVVLGGIKSDISALGTSGEATFDGLATATLSEVGPGGTVNFVEDGRYIMTYDFGSRTGAATITGIAGSIFVSTVSEGAASADNHFGGVLQDAATFTSVGSVDGSFFTDGTDPASATAGTFSYERAVGGGVTQSAMGAFEAPNVTQ